MLITERYLHPRFVHRLLPEGYIVITSPVDTAKTFPATDQECHTQMLFTISACSHERAFTISAYRPVERIAIDYIHKLNNDQNGKEHILVIIDSITRFVICKLHVNIVLNMFEPCYGRCHEAD